MDPAQALCYTAIASVVFLDLWAKFAWGYEVIHLVLVLEPFNTYEYKIDVGTAAFLMYVAILAIYFWFPRTMPDWGVLFGYLPAFVAGLIGGFLVWWYTKPDPGYESPIDTDDFG